jgi:hypothetical protein
MAVMACPGLLGMYFGVLGVSIGALLLGAFIGWTARH